MNRHLVLDRSSAQSPVRAEQETHSGTPLAPKSPKCIRRKIWIDIDNSPHVPFFKPIMRKLEKQGFEIILTARDTYQVCDLLKFHQLSCKVVGRHYGKSKLLKVLGNCLRTAQLLPMAAKLRPDLALSHGSRAQILTGQ